MFSVKIKKLYEGITKNESKKLFITISIILSISFIFSFTAAADENLVPSWIKNTAKFWVDGKIGDNEFIAAIQFLIQNDVIVIGPNYEGFVDVKGELFTILYKEDSMKNPISPRRSVTMLTNLPSFALDPTKNSIYEEIGNLDKSQNTVFVYPMFTQSAYEDDGFYSYYNELCDESCLTVDIKTDQNAEYTSSTNAATILFLLGYDYILDMDIDKDPSILNEYDKIILLHNEYVTQKMFDAITSHPKVIYLYPNALYAEINVDYQSNTITLKRGHGYPTNVDNGFDWEFDNTRPYEFDNRCLEWEFNEINNGIMLNCYPEHVIFKDYELLRQVKLF